MCYLIYSFLRGASPLHSPRIGNAPQAHQELQISSREISNIFDSFTIFNLYSDSHSDFFDDSSEEYPYWACIWFLINF